MTEASITGSSRRSALVALSVACVLLIFIVVLPVIAAFTAQSRKDR